MPGRPARTKPALHIAACLKVIARHRNAPGLTVGGARDEIKRLAGYALSESETTDDVHLREHLQRSTGLDIQDLATRTDQWPKGI